MDTAALSNTMTPDTTTSSPATHIMMNGYPFQFRSQSVPPITSNPNNNKQNKPNTTTSEDKPQNVTNTSIKAANDGNSNKPKASHVTTSSNDNNKNDGTTTAVSNNANKDHTTRKSHAIAPANVENKRVSTTTKKPRNYAIPSKPLKPPSYYYQNLDLNLDLVSPGTPHIFFVIRMVQKFLKKLFLYPYYFRFTDQS